MLTVSLTITSKLVTCFYRWDFTKALGGHKCRRTNSFIFIHWSNLFNECIFGVCLLNWIGQFKFNCFVNWPPYICLNQAIILDLTFFNQILGVGYNVVYIYIPHVLHFHQHFWSLIIFIGSYFKVNFSTPSCCFMDNFLCDRRSMTWEYFKTLQ